jgi:sugar (pentulose or hexulose) kinase
MPLSIRQDLAAIAINGTSSTVLVCDRQGNPLSEPLLYNDGRGITEIDRIEALLPENTVVQNATSSLAKLLWWQNQSQLPEKGHFLHQADWLAGLLHGRWGISDYHNALKLGYDVVNLEYPAILCNQSFFGLLPQVLTPGEGVGLIQKSLANQFQISTACQICTGTTDSIAAFLAAGVNRPGDAVTSLGSTLVLKLLSHSPIEDRASGIYSHRFGKLWLTGGASNTGGAVLRHFFSDEALFTLSQQINSEFPSPFSYYPLLTPGDRFPINDPQLVPILEPRPDDPVQFLHGLLESIAKIEKMGYKQLQKLGSSPLQQVYTAGGGAQNRAWQKIRARQLQVPVLPSPHTEAAYGTALLAQQGLI